MAIVASLATIVAAAVPSLPALLSAQRLGGGKFVREGAQERELAVTWPGSAAGALDDATAAFAPPILKKVSRVGAAEAVRAAVEAAQHADDDALQNVVLHIGGAAGIEEVEETPSVTLPIRHVHFDLLQNTAHEIMPYREVYNGVHPKDFNFGKGLPAPGSCFFDPAAEHPILTLEGFRLRGYEYDSDDSDSDSDDDEFEPKTWKGVCARRLGSGVAAVPRPVLYVFFVLLLFMRAFCDEIATEFRSGFPLADKLF